MRSRAAAFLALAALWRLALFVGPQGSDDLAYSELARDLVLGDYELRSEIFPLRLGYVFGIALFYGLFGAGSFTLVAFNLAASVAELAVAWKVARQYLDETGARWAVVLLALFPVHVFHAADAHPDVPAALAATGAVALFLKARAADRRALFFVAGLALGAGHLVKESAFFGLAALLAVGGKPRPRYAWAAAGFAAVVALEAAFFAATTGDPLYRFHAVRDEQVRVMMSSYYLQQVPTWRRLLVDVPMMFFNPLGGGFPFFMLLPWGALAGAAWALVRKDTALRPVVLWAAAILGLLVLWPIQWIPYRPAMVAHPRIFLAAAVPLAILAASLLRRLPPRAAWAAGVLVLAAALPASWALHRDGRRFSEGARAAWGALPADLPVVSDPRTIQFFRLYEGYRGKRAWRDWTEPLPPRPYVRVENGTWQRLLAEWYGQKPPAGFAEAGETLLAHELPRRSGLRGMLRRGAPAGTDRVRVIRIP